MNARLDETVLRMQSSLPFTREAGERQEVPNPRERKTKGYEPLRWERDNRLPALEAGERQQSTSLLMETTGYEPLDRETWL
jgi:hypothetical protein